MVGVRSPGESNESVGTVVPASRRQPRAATAAPIRANPTLQGRQPVDLRGGTMVAGAKYPVSFPKKAVRRVGALTTEAFEKAAAEWRANGTGSMEPGAGCGFACATERPPGRWVGFGVACEREGVTRAEQLAGEAAEASVARRLVARPVKRSALKGGRLAPRRNVGVTFAQGDALATLHPIPAREELPNDLWWRPGEASPL